MTMKRWFAVAFDVLILLAAVFCARLLLRQGDVFWNWLFIAVVLAGAGLLAWELRCVLRMAVPRRDRWPAVSTLVLLGERDRPVRVWELTGKVGLLLGKTTGEQEADIDLSGTAYHAAIDEAHATLNYTGSGWWLEDISTRGGVAVRRGKERLLLAPQAPLKLRRGDVIHVAGETRLVVN